MSWSAMGYHIIIINTLKMMKECVSSQENSRIPHMVMVANSFRIVVGLAGG